MNRSANSNLNWRICSFLGSCTKGNYKEGSDVDLAIKSDRLTYKITVRLADCLNEEKPLTYFFDVFHYEVIADPMLKAHIDRVGVNLKE